MNRDYKLTLTLTDPYGKETVVSVPVSKNVLGDKNIPLDNMQPPTPFDTRTFEESVEVIKQKYIRKDLFKGVASKLGGQLADYLDDREGWYGEERRENILNNEK